MLVADVSLNGRATISAWWRSLRILRVLIEYLLPCDDATVWMRVPRRGGLGRPGRGALLLKSGASGGGCRDVIDSGNMPANSISGRSEGGVGDVSADEGGVGCVGGGGRLGLITF